MMKYREPSNKFDRVKNLDIQASDQEIRYLSLNCALHLIDLELSRGSNNVTLNSEMTKLEEYTYIIEKLLKNQK